MSEAKSGTSQTARFAIIASFSAIVQKLCTTCYVAFACIGFCLVPVGHVEAAIAYVQSNVATQSSSGTTLSASFNAAQSAGNFNVLIIAWSSSTTQAPSISDTNGNTYTLVVGPTRSGTSAQSIYYAKNIASGANAVTATFTASVTYRDMRIAEYSGIDITSPSDGSSGATGTGTAITSGSFTTTNANDLLVAGDYLGGATIAPGSGYTQRQLSSLSSIYEDQIVGSAGSYAGTATQSATGWYIMQAAAFKAAVSGGQAPTAPSNLAAAAASSTQVNLSWTASTDSTGVTAYYVERCAGAGCTNFTQVGSVSGNPPAVVYSDTGLSAGTTYLYRVRATDAAALLSAYSGSASATTQSSGTSSITYIQSKAATQSASGTSLSVSYPSAQVAGDFNVLIVAWSSSTTQAPTITDGKGNTYALAVGPTRSGNSAQSIYYAKNIAAGTNAVTATFSSAVTYLDMRIGEYAGIDVTSPVNGAIGGTGTTVAMTSGNITTTNANDLLVAGNYLGGSTTAPGAGYTQRQLTSLSSIYEDQVVNAAGVYAGTATQSATGWYVFQVAAFKAATSTGPTAPGNLVVTPVSGTQVNLSWTASTDPSGVTGYLIERCTGIGCTSFTQVASISSGTTYSDTGLNPSSVYSYRVRGTDSSTSGAYSTIAANASTPVPVGTAGNVTYGYDSLGRLVEVASANLGNVQAYSYDAAGNVVSSAVAGSGTLSETGFSKTQGGSGTQVIIYGSGFSTTPSSDSVTFNGVAATVNSATSSQLLVTVPSGATTGPVKVTIAGSTVTSATNFSIVTSNNAPTISGFSPSNGVPGSTITITGTNFQAVAGNSRVLIGGATAAITAATSTSLTVTVPSNPASGHIQVITPYGSATSTGDFFGIPAAFSTFALGQTSRTTQNATGSTVSMTASPQLAMILFDGTQGDQYVRVAAVGPSTWSIQVIDPTGNVIVTGSPGTAIDLPTLKLTGTYSIAVGSGAGGSGTIYVTKAKQEILAMTWQDESPGDANIPTTIVLTSTSQRQIYTFRGAAGQYTALSFGYVYGAGTVTVLDAYGVSQYTAAISSSTANTTLTFGPLSASGDYRVIFDPGNNNFDISFISGLVPNPSTSLIAGGPAISVVGSQPYTGSPFSENVMAVNFNGTAGQWLSLGVGYGSQGAFFYDLNIYYTSGGTRHCLGTCGSGGDGGVLTYYFGPLPATATYTIFAAFAASNTPSNGTVYFQIWNPSTLTANASASVVPIDIGDYAYGIFQFAGTSGKSYTFKSSTNCLGSWKLYGPTNTVISSGSNVTGGTAALGTLPSTGSYTLVTNEDSLFIGGSSGNWSPNVQNCSVQITQP